MHGVRERMSETEAVMWTVEKDPSLRSDFLNITLLDGPPDLDRLRAKVERAIDDLPRLRQRVVSAPLRLAPPEWADDPEFDLDYHVRRVAVPAPGDRRGLLDLCATLGATPFDRARPLWDLTVVEGLDGGRAALVQRVHHTIIDGVGGVRFSMALLDLERQPSEPPEATDGQDAEAVAPVHRETPLDVLVGSLAYAARRQAESAFAALRSASHIARHPTEGAAAAGRFVRTIRSIPQQVFVAGGALSPLMTTRSLRRRFDALAFPLSAARAAAKSLDGTVNDVFVTGVAGGLGLYHERMGQPVEELRMAMPISLRGDDEGVAGNRFAPARVVVPVTPKDPRPRFEATRERLRGVRGEPVLGLVDAVAGIVGLLPTSIVVPVTRAQTRTIDFVASNVRGAPFDLYLCGARIEANHPIGPTTGAAVNVTTLSYRDSLDIGVNADTAAVTDPEALTDCIRESFAALLDLAG